MSFPKFQDRFEALFLSVNSEFDVVPSIRALVFELLRIDPRDLTSITAVHECWEKVMVTITTDPASFMGVDLEFVTHLMTSTAALGHMSHLCDIDWFFRHTSSRLDVFV